MDLNLLQTTAETGLDKKEGKGLKSIGIIPAHNGRISCLVVNQDGTKCASASEKVCTRVYCIFYFSLCSFGGCLKRVGRVGSQRFW